ncbi:hypothetical protein ACFL9U_04935 [Thermodesulfobacteriota bacterium]
MNEHQEQVLELLKDLLKINAIIATELIQVVENSSQQIRGEIPDSCKIQHLELKRQLVQIAEKWHKDCGMLRAHNLNHGA